MKIYPGFAASEVLYGRHGEVAGVATGDVGIAKDGSQKDAFSRGMELRSRVTLLAEGCRGSLSEVRASLVRHCVQRRHVPLRHCDRHYVWTVFATIFFVAIMVLSIWLESCRVS